VTKAPDLSVFVMRIGSTSSSAGVMPRCFPGSSRKYHSHTTAQARLTIPSSTNDPRHVTSAISQATKGGVSALPNRALEWVCPERTRVFLPVSSQTLLALQWEKWRLLPTEHDPSDEHAGEAAHQSVNKVAVAQIIAETVRVRRVRNDRLSISNDL